MKTRCLILFIGFVIVVIGDPPYENALQTSWHYGKDGKYIQIYRLWIELDIPAMG